MATLTAARQSASFRDPSGFVFLREGRLLRQVNETYGADYDALMGSGLYDELVAGGQLVAHRELPLTEAAAPGAYRVLEPERVPFISYPYEWSFSQLRDAALLTLQIQESALQRGMTLKDASAYNIQFVDGRPVHIDTLSFERYIEGTPWVAYRQFCQHFLVPLLLMSHVDARLGRLLQTHLDGVPIDLGSRLLPRRTLLRWGTLLHVHLHARSLARHVDTRLNQRRVTPRMSLTAQRGLIDSLATTLRRLRWKPAGTEWADYASRNSYDDVAHESKAAAVRRFLAAAAPDAATVWDVGANTGVFSRVAAATGAMVVAFDIDPAAVELNYLRQREDGGGPILPLLLDLTNPSPAIGWDNAERDAWRERGLPDAVLALALIHHLAISHNLPLDALAGFFASIAPVLIIEFVPKSDSQVQRLLGSRRDIFTDYDEQSFVAAFSEWFDVRDSELVEGTDRRLFLMVRR